eukprot:3237086-Rhodomonas_salina.1
MARAISWTSSQAGASFMKTCKACSRTGSSCATARHSGKESLLAARQFSATACNRCFTPSDPPCCTLLSSHLTSFRIASSRALVSLGSSLSARNSNDLSFCPPSKSSRYRDRMLVSASGAGCSGAVLALTRKRKNSTGIDSPASLSCFARACCGCLSAAEAATHRAQRWRRRTTQMSSACFPTASTSPWLTVQTKRWMRPSSAPTLSASKSDMSGLSWL